jgi:hypothetical protein
MIQNQATSSKIKYMWAQRQAIENHPTEDFNKMKRKKSEEGLRDLQYTIKGMMYLLAE